jgi:peroxiredoxin
MKKIILITTLVAGIFATTTSMIPSGYSVGDNAADFKLKNVDGKMVSLADYKSAKGFIVVFTCNHCPYAKAYEQRIMDLDKMYNAKGYPVIAISSNDVSAVPEDSYTNMIARAKDKAYTFPYLYDETQQVAREYGAQRTPHVFILQKVSTGLQVKYIGAIDDNTDNPSAVQHKYVEDAVNALLAGKPVPVTETKAIGCGISWKNS